MKIKLPQKPKGLRGFSFERLFSFEMNDFEVEALLPALFYLIRTGGKQRGKLVDPTAIKDRRDDLSRHESVEGFTDTEGLRVLDKWIRTSFIDTACRGETKREGEQIFYIRPLSFLSYKPGFPAEGRRVRGVPAFLYWILADEQSSNLHQGRDRQLRDVSPSGPMRGLMFVQEAFSEGLRLEGIYTYGGKYDGSTHVDIETLGLLYYLDGFEPCVPSLTEVKKPPRPALRQSARRIARDVTLLISAYRSRVPSRTLAQFLTGLLNFEMFVYTLELQQVVNRLVEEGVKDPYWELSEANLTSPVRFYVDMIGDRNHLSARMAQEQVEAHFAVVERFFRANLLLRTLHRYVMDTPVKPDLGGEDVAGTMQAILRSRSDPKIRARADVEWSAIRDENSWTDEDEIPEEVKRLREGTQDELEALLRLLAEAQRSKTIHSMLQWYRSVGGLVRSDGILEGNLRGRRVWRLHMSDGLLEILVQLCCVMPDYADEKPQGERYLHHPQPRPVSLANFLRFLEERYGIIVDRPPDWMRSVETVAAAKENFEALKRRLRQMGMFEDLSDDYNAQYIEPRYVGEELGIG